MQLTSLVLFLSTGATSVSAFPGAFPRLQTRQEAATNETTGPKNASFACDHSHNLVSTQLDQMTRLKADKISVPPYLAGYYTAINSGRQEIGCPDDTTVKRDVTPIQEPCDVVNDQHERMMVLINKFDTEGIAVAPFIAGFLSATLDGNKALSCPTFTGPATEEAVARGNSVPAVDMSS